MSVWVENNNPQHRNERIQAILAVIITLFFSCNDVGIYLTLFICELVIRLSHNIVPYLDVAAKECKDLSKNHTYRQILQFSF